MGTVRAMTWNVWWQFGDRWRERQIGIAATLAAHRPDVVGLQESWAGRESSQAEVLAAPLGLHSVFGGPSLPDPVEEPGHDGVDLGLAILSRWPIRHAWTHRLPSSRTTAPVALVAAVDHPRGASTTCCCAPPRPDRSRRSGAPPSSTTRSGACTRPTTSPSSPTWTYDSRS